MILSNSSENACLRRDELRVSLIDSGKSFLDAQ